MATHALRSVSNPADGNQDSHPVPTITHRVGRTKRRDGLRLGFDTLENRVVLSTTTLSSAAALQMAREMVSGYRGGGSDPVLAAAMAISQTSKGERSTLRQSAPPQVCEPVPYCDPVPVCNPTPTCSPTTAGDLGRRRCESVPLFNPNENCYPTPNCEPRCEVRPTLEKTQRGSSKPNVESKQRAETKSTPESKQRCETRPVCEVKQVCEVRPEREAKSTRGEKQSCDTPTDGQSRGKSEMKQVCEIQQRCEAPPRCNDNVPVRTASGQGSKSNNCNTAPTARNGQQCENKQNDCRRNECQQAEVKQSSRQQCDTAAVEKVAKAVDKCFGDMRFVSQASRWR